MVIHATRGESEYPLFNRLVLDYEFIQLDRVLQKIQVSPITIRGINLSIAFVANVCGCDDWEEVVAFCRIKIELFKPFLELPHGIPSHDTFSRVFSMIDTYRFEEIFVEWMSEVFVVKRGDCCFRRQKH